MQRAFAMPATETTNKGALEMVVKRSLQVIALSTILLLNVIPVAQAKQTFSPWNNPQATIKSLGDSQSIYYYEDGFNVAVRMMSGTIGGRAVEFRYSSAVKDGYPSIQLRAQDISVLINGIPAQIWSRAEALSFITHKINEGETLNALAAGAAAVNASRISGRDSIRGNYDESVTNEAGNRYRVKGTYSGTATDRDEQRRAAAAAAEGEARAHAVDESSWNGILSFEEKYYAAEGEVQPGGFIGGSLIADLPKSFGVGSLVVVTIVAQGQRFTFRFIAN